MISPWLALDRSLQVSQISTLSREVLTACTYLVAKEVSSSVSRKVLRNKSSLAEFIVNTIRSSLFAVLQGSVLSSSDPILHGLCNDPVVLTNADALLTYIQQLLEVSVFENFSADLHMSVPAKERLTRYAKHNKIIDTSRSQRKKMVNTSISQDCLPPVTDWSVLTPRELILQWVKPLTCAVCARCKAGSVLKQVKILLSLSSLPLVDILRIPSLSPLSDSHQFQSPTLA